MQEEEKKIEPMVDIDTSGPGADIELPEEKPEAEVETKEDSSPAPQAEETREEKAEGSDAQPEAQQEDKPCLLYTSPSPRDGLLSRMPSSA